MKISEIHDMTVEELQDKYEVLVKELFNLRLQKATGQLQNTALIRKLKREVAAILTIKNEKSRHE